jgi:hypothetical protein
MTKFFEQEKWEFLTRGKDRRQSKKRLMNLHLKDRERNYLQGDGVQNSLDKDFGKTPKPKFNPILVAAFLAVFLFPVKSFAVWFAGSGPDYSQGAASEFYCADVAGSPVTTAAGLSQTGPALVLVNPSASGKNLVILDVGIDITAAPAAAAQFMLAYSTGGVNISTSVVTSSGGIVGFSTNTLVTPARLLTVVDSSQTQVGLSLGQCLGGQGTALPSKPTAFRYIGGTTGAAAISGVTLTDQTQGKVVVPPGGVVSIQSTSAASILAHLLWREDPGN